MRLSYSKISTFFDCGFRYRLRYIEKVQSKPKPHLRLGNVLHSVLGKFYRYQGEGKPNLDYLLSLYEGAWTVQNESQRRYYELGLEILSEYYRLNINSWRPPIWVECIFDVPIGEHSISGVFDRVDRLEDGRYEIIDYKAQKELPSQEEVDSDLQLSLYALAFQKIMGTTPHLLSLYHLRDNKKLTTTRSEEDLRQVESKILEVAEGISKARRLQPRENDGCRWCDYRVYCLLKSEEPLPIPKKRDQMSLAF